MRSPNAACEIILPISLSKELIMAEMDHYSRSRMMRRINRDHVSQIIFVNPNFSNNFLIFLASLEKLNKNIVIISNRGQGMEEKVVVALARGSYHNNLFIRRDNVSLFKLLDLAKKRISQERKLVITNFWTVSVIVGTLLLEQEFPVSLIDQRLLEKSPLPTDQVSNQIRSLFLLIRESLEGKELSANRSREFEEILRVNNQ